MRRFREACEHKRGKHKARRIVLGQRVQDDRNAQDREAGKEQAAPEFRLRLRDIGGTRGSCGGGELGKLRLIILEPGEAVAHPAERPAEYIADRYAEDRRNDQRKKEKQIKILKTFYKLWKK